MAARLWCLVATLALAAGGISPAQADLGWRYPVGGMPYVLRGFDPPAQPWLGGHRGVDLAMKAFEPVLVAAAGTVTFAAPIAGQGVVVVSHGSLRSTYEPVDAGVGVGDRVAAGDVLGWLEPATVHCGRTCLHWGVLRGDTYLDPLSLVDSGPAVLLPLGAPVHRVSSPPALSFSAVGGALAAVSPAPAALAWVILIGPPCSVCSFYLRPGP